MEQMIDHRTVGHMATYPARSDTLEVVVNRIADQLDKLTVVLNEYSSHPQGDFRSNVDFIIPNEDLKDVGKFLPEVDPDDFVFMFDDDILYPDDYVTSTLNKIKDHTGPAIFGYHGSRYLPAKLSWNPISWYGCAVHFLFAGNLRKSRKVFHFQRHVSKWFKVDQLGSGVAVARGVHLPPFEVMRDSQKFTDVRLALWAKRTEIPLFCLPHSAGWLETLDFEEEIFRSFTRRTPENVLREIYEFAGCYRNSRP